MLRVAADAGDTVHVPAGVIAQAWRDGRRQVLLVRALRHCHEVPLDGLLARAAGLLDAAPGTLAVVDGVVGVPGGNRHLSYGELVAGQRIRLRLDEGAALKPVAEHRIVGQPAPRIDIPAKATGEFTYVHDVRVPGMLHGRVVRPPYAGLDAGPFVGSSLLAVDEASVAGVPGPAAPPAPVDLVIGPAPPRPGR